MFIFCYSLVAGRLELAATSGPIVFVVAGLLMGPLGLSIGCFSVAQSLHGSGYIAAFTGGLLFGFMAKEATHRLVLAAEAGKRWP